ncbi:hypothetical protein D3X13_35720 [Streptomyces fradiae]|nr:hypothetical protein D3X13_35720 [Streptomyces fradiae]
MTSTRTIRCAVVSPASSARSSSPSATGVRRSTRTPAAAGRHRRLGVGGPRLPGRHHVIAGDSAGGAWPSGPRCTTVTTAASGSPRSCWCIRRPTPTFGRRPSAGTARGTCRRSTTCAGTTTSTFRTRHAARTGRSTCWAPITGGCRPPWSARAEFDPLHDEGVELAVRLAAHGVEVHHVPAPGLVHGYLLMADIVPAAAVATKKVLTAVEQMLAPMPMAQ